MKRITNLLMAAAVLFTAFACDIIPQPEEDLTGSQYLAGPALEILSQDVVFGPQGGTGEIVVNTTESLSVLVNRPWVETSVSGDRVTLTVSANGSIESRYATVTLKAGKKSAEVTVHQYGVNSAYVWESSYTFPYAGGSVSLSYGDLGTVWVDVSDVPWLSAEVRDEETAIVFTAAKSIFNYERKGKVTVTIGELVRELTFVQEPNPAGLNPGEEVPGTYEVQQAWTPKYYEPTDPDATTTTVGVDVAEGFGGRYFIKVVPQADYSAVGDEQLFLVRNAPAWAAETPTIHRTTSTEELDKLANGSYRIYAVGVGNDNKVNYTYAVATFRVTRVLSPYEKFLGTWSVTRGEFEDTWTIVEKEPGKSYTITGLEGGSQAFLGEYELTAEFDGTDNSFTIATHMDLGPFSFTSSGKQHDVTMRFTGYVEYQGSLVSVGGNYTICRCALTGNGEMTVTAGPALKLQGFDGEFPLLAMCFNGLEGNSAWSFDNGQPYTFPFTATQLTQGDGSGGGGDDPDDPDDPGTDAYGKWLGTWTVAGVDLTVSQKEAGKTYTVSGLEGYDIETRFADGKMEFFYQELAEDGDRLLAFFGIDDDGDGYIIEGDPANDGWLATATLDDSGKTASLVGAEFDAVYSGTTYHERVVVILLLIYDSSSGKFYYASDDPVQIDLPAKMTKAGSSTFAAQRSAVYDMAAGRFIPLYKTFKSGPAVPYKYR